jgi:hypothetical protein
MISVQDIVYARYQVSDLDAAAQFMSDYVPSVRTDDALYMRGYGPGHHIYVAERGPEARSIRFAVAAKSAVNLEKLSAETGASVELINEHGGGKRVVLTDPSGYRTASRRWCPWPRAGSKRSTSAASASVLTRRCGLKPVPHT